MIDKSVDQVARQVLKGHIRQLQLVPPAAIKLLRLTNDENAMIRDLSGIIETEPTLAAKVLRNVNSAAYALPNKITSIHRAVNLLGFSAVRQIALNLLFYQKLINYKANSEFDQMLFWQHCLFVASLSRGIALALKHPDPDMVYTAGLLHDIGKIVLESYGNVTYSNFIADCKTEPSVEESDERHFFGLTHSDIGRLFCLEWGLPPAITAVVACHHQQPDDSAVDAGFKKEIAIVSFANYIAWMQGIGSAEINYEHKLSPAILNVIDISRLDLEYLLGRVDTEMGNTREFYGIDFPAVTKLRATLVKSIIGLNQENGGYPLLQKPVSNDVSAYLTLPHKSLDPNEFVPCTLEAIQNHFEFDRVMMLGIDPKRRCLIPFHCQQKPNLAVNPQSFEINISSVSGQLLNCLREKQAVIVDDRTLADKQILLHLHVNSFIAIPITYQERLIAVLYADNPISNKPVTFRQLSEIIPVANELGIALTHAQQYEAEKKRAQLDPLTGLYNKRMIDSFLSQIFLQDTAQKQKLAVGFVDVDNFKRLNDSCGHQAGDDALKMVADILRGLTRPRDFIGRYGGEEFLFVLKNTNKIGAYGYAERIRTEIERRGIMTQHRFNNHALTASIGISMYDHQFMHYTDMVETADQAMYRAKHEGRNKVVLLNSPQFNKFANVKYAR